MTEIAPSGSLRAPFPWFGGKSRVAEIVWDRFGDPANYVEPFCGSAAVMLARPTAPKTETVNDVDCYVANFWRAVRNAPEEVARWADYPVSEVDQNARHLWLVSRADLRERMHTDPDWYDAKAAGWWVYGQNTWIGSGWCDQRFWRDAGNAGKGVHRKLPHLGDARKGIHRQLPHLGDAGNGVHRQAAAIEGWMLRLAARLRRVRVCCGDWSRVLGPSVTTKHGVTAVFLDPPYLSANDGTYATGDGCGVAHDVREWAIEHGGDPLFRIALCGYEGEHAMPDDWERYAWKAHGGYGSQSDGAGRANAGRERIWFSPHCLQPEGRLF